MKRPLFAVITLLISSVLMAAERDVAPPVEMPYAQGRKLLTVDSLLLEWKDIARNRTIPIKIYYSTNSPGPFPVIIFSHGLGGTRETYEYLGRQWAANGYISVHVQHPGSDDSAWRGRANPMEGMREAITLQNVLDRDKDVKFTLDQLDALNKNDSKLKGMLDLKNIGMAGHSFGAQTTLMIAGQRLGGGGPLATRLSANLSDERIKAAIPMSASLPSVRNDLDGAFGGIKMPVFYMTGSLDDSPLGDTTAAERRLVYDHTRSAAAAYLLTLTGGDHMVFSGRLADRPDDVAFQKLIRLGSTAFWDSYLKGDPAAKKWLDDGGFKATVAGSGVLERK